MGDVVSDWMRVTSAQGVVLARNHLPARWAVRLPERAATAFHFLARGAGVLVVEGHAPIALEAGDLALVPRGHEHIIASGTDVPPLSLDEVVARAPTPLGEPHVTTLVCGEYTTSAQADGRFLRALPDTVHFSRAELEGDGALQGVLGLLARELEDETAASEVLVRSLLDALFVYVLRAWARTRAGRGNWLSALRDPALARALCLMHEDPAREWTVDALAKVAHVSRAAFARRFLLEVGEPPMEYLTGWRMALASRLLTQENLSVGEIAARVGYASEFAFSRAFKRTRGVAPSIFRRTRASATSP